MNDSGHLPLNKELECDFFILPGLIGVTDQNGVSIDSSDIFDRFND
jgi:hypothetical protein